MDIADFTTSPILTSAPEPLVLVIDACEERSMLLVRLLAFANYRTYVVRTLQEASSWYIEHAIPPEAIVFGDMNSLEHFFVRRLQERISIQQGKYIPAISLALYLPHTPFTKISSASTCSYGYFALLELLWQVVPRYV